MSKQALRRLRLPRLKRLRTLLRLSTVLPGAALVVTATLGAQSSVPDIPFDANADLLKLPKGKEQGAIVPQAYVVDHGAALL